jgi:hypothetical protein
VSIREQDGEREFHHVILADDSGLDRLQDALGALRQFADFQREASFVRRGDLPCTYTYKTQTFTPMRSFRYDFSSML